MYELTVIKYPSGAYGFAGSVPVELAYEMVDGSPLDPDQVRIARHCGPGFAKKLKGRSWPTEAAALAAAAEVRGPGDVRVVHLFNHGIAITEADQRYNPAGAVDLRIVAQNGQGNNANVVTLTVEQQAELFGILAARASGLR